MPIPLVSRSINTVTFVASATASSSRSDDDAMSVASRRRSDKAIDAVPPPPFGLMEVADDLCVARRRRCPCIASSSLLDLLSQAPSANIIVFMDRDTYMPLTPADPAMTIESCTQSSNTSSKSGPAPSWLRPPSERERRSWLFGWGPGADTSYCG